MASLPARPTSSRTVEFRPRYPLDPFAPSSSSLHVPPGASYKPAIDLHNPWLLKADNLPSSLSLRRDVVLVLGPSALHTIHSFLASPGLANSLVIIVTHAPPKFPLSYPSTIRILRLRSPLEVQDGGSVRLVSILEWAEKIGRIWRVHGANGLDLLEFDESSMENLALLSRIIRSKPTSPPSSNSDLGKSSWRNSSLLVSSKRTSLLTKRKDSSPSPKYSSLPVSALLPPIDPTQRPFDAVINYITEGISEKQSLKQTILVASITRPFLASTLSPYHKLAQLRDNGKSNRKSIAFRNSTLYSLPPTPPYNSGDSLHQTPSNATANDSISSTFAGPSQVAHMIHVLPSRSRPPLIQSLDSFLSSFSVTNVGDDIEYAKQYFMYGSTLSDAVTYSQDKENAVWLVSDLILNGNLDAVRGKSWIGSSEDILFLPPGGGTFTSKPSQPPGTRNLQAARSASEHGFVIPRIQLMPQSMVPSQLEEPFATSSDVKELTPPPTPPNRTRSTTTLGTKYETPPMFPGHTPRPRPYANNSRPHSETIVSVGVAFGNETTTPSTPRSLNRNIPRAHRLSAVPLVAPNQSPKLIPRLPHASSTPSLARIASSAGNDDQRVLPKSKLNMTVDVAKEENVVQDKLEPSRRLLTPLDDSNESTNRMTSYGGLAAGDDGARKLRWKFWKG